LAPEIIWSSWRNLGMERVVTFQRGPLGLYFQDGGVVKKVDPAGPSGLKGVLPGWCITRVGKEDVAGKDMRAILAILMKTKSSLSSYTMTFSMAPPEDFEKGPAGAPWSSVGSSTFTGESLQVDSHATKKTSGVADQKSAGYTVEEAMIAEEGNDGEMRSYMVDNSELKSGTPGLGYRSAASLGMVDPNHAMAPWGSTVQGVPQGGDWVKLGPKSFLPIIIAGKTVLKDAQPFDLPA